MRTVVSYKSGRLWNVDTIHSRKRDTIILFSVYEQLLLVPTFLVKYWLCSTPLLPRFSLHLYFMVNLMAERVLTNCLLFHKTLVLELHVCLGPESNGNMFTIYFKNNFGKNRYIWKHRPVVSNERWNALRISPRWKNSREVN